VHIETLTSLQQNGVSLVYGKDAPAPVEIGDVAGLQTLPAPVPHALGEHGVEDQTASRR